MFLSGVAIGLALGAAIGLLIGMLFSDQTPAPKEPLPPGRLIHKVDHRCNPPSSFWSTYGECLIKYGDEVRPGDQWVCECLKVWEAKAGHWQVVEDDS